MKDDGRTGSRFSPPEQSLDIERPGPGTVVLRGFALDRETALLDGIAEIAARAPFRHMVTPGGFPLSVAMTNCGRLGWVTDRGGYRYDRMDPDTGRPWPPLPDWWLGLAIAAAARGGFSGFEPDACLINRYGPGAKMSLHQDRDERDLAQPIVSVSLGLPAVFQLGGTDRKARPVRIDLAHGDVMVWGGPDRLRYHGILPLKDGHHPRLGRVRLNLTFRTAG